MHGIGELEGESRLEVGSSAGSDTRCRSGAPTAEHLPEQIPESRHIGGVEREPAGVRPETSNLVVLGALLLVSEHVVGGGDLLEALLGRAIAWVLVRMQLAGEFPVRLGDGTVIGASIHTEHGVVIGVEPLALSAHRHIAPTTSGRFSPSSSPWPGAGSGPSIGSRCASPRRRRPHRRCRPRARPPQRPQGRTAIRRCRASRGRGASAR